MQISDEDLKVVIFKLDEIEFGLPIDQVQSIERMTLLTKMPNMPDFVRGIMDFRDSVMPVLDLVQLLLREKLVENELTRIITVKDRDQSIGMLVDAATDVIDITSSSIQQPDFIDNYAIPFLTGIANLPNRLLILIDIYQLLSNIPSSSMIDFRDIHKMELTK